MLILLKSGPDFFWAWQMISDSISDRSSDASLYGCSFPHLSHRALSGVWSTWPRLAVSAICAGCHLQYHFIPRKMLKIRSGAPINISDTYLNFYQRPVLPYLLAVVILLGNVTDALNWCLKDIDGNLLIKLKLKCVYIYVYISGGSHGNWVASF